MMQIDIRYHFGKGPYVVGGDIDNIPFELEYFYNEAYLVVLTPDFVLRTQCMYNPIEGKLDHILTGQLIFNLARQLNGEF